MNLKKRFSPKQEGRFYYEDPNLRVNMSTTVLNWFPRTTQKLALVCIGTDRSTGDSLGPLTGTLLKEKALSHFFVYGSLDQPVHAVNLKEKLAEINHEHDRPFIIAIDACLGKAKSVGSIITANEPVKPGAALKKDLPYVGDIHISGVVNVGGYMEYFVLQNTRLHIVMQMANKIAGVIEHLDSKLNSHSPSVYLQSSTKSIL